MVIVTVCSWTGNPVGYQSEVAGNNSLDFQQLVWQEKYKLMDLDESSVIRGLYDDSSGDFLFYEPDKLRERVRTASGMIRENLEKIALYERKQIMESVEDFCGRITQWSDPVTRGSHPGIHTDERDIEILYRYCSIFYTLRKMMFRNIQEMTSALFLYFVKIFGPITFGQIKKLFPHRIIETVRQFGERLAESGYVEIGDGKQGGRGAKCRISKKGDRYLSRMLRYIDEKINASARKDYEKTTEIVGITKDLFEAATSVFVRHR